MIPVTKLIEWAFVPHLPSLPGKSTTETVEVAFDFNDEDWERLQYALPAVAGLGTFYLLQHPEVIGYLVAGFTGTVKSVTEVVK